MKKYFLIVLGEFENEEACKEVALTLTPIVDSPQLKFNHSKGNLIFHFASEVSQEEIYDYILGSIFDLCSSFILMENTDKVSLYLPKNIKQHLLDLDKVGEDVDIKININQNRPLSELEGEEEFVALLLDEVKKQVKRPSLDQILDKININGIDSLTKFEKDTLDEHSKNFS